MGMFSWWGLNCVNSDKGSYIVSDQYRLISDCADAQADLTLVAYIIYHLQFEGTHFD